MGAPASNGEGPGLSDVDTGDLVPGGTSGIRRLLERFVEVGFSKFVVRPILPPPSLRDEIGWLADGVLDLQR